MKFKTPLFAALILCQTPFVFAETPTTATTTTSEKPKGDFKEKRMEHLEESFTAHDLDKDGKLSLDEFKALEKDRMQKMREHKREMLSKNPEFIKKHDTNKDGKIDDDEFKAAMQEIRSKS